MIARTDWPPRRADIAPPEAIETLGDTGPVPLDQQLVEMPSMLDDLFAPTVIVPAVMVMALAAGTLLWWWQ